MHLFIVLFTYLTTPFAFYDMQVKRLNTKRKAPIERNNICPKISKEKNSDFFILGRTLPTYKCTPTMALLIKIQHIPLQNDDSHQMLCICGKPLFIIFCRTAYEMVENIEKSKWRRCVKTFTYSIRVLKIANLLFQHHE